MTRERENDFKLESLKSSRTLPLKYTKRIVVNLSENKLSDGKIN